MKSVKVGRSFFRTDPWKNHAPPARVAVVWQTMRTDERDEAVLAKGLAEMPVAFPGEVEAVVYYRSPARLACHTGLVPYWHACHIWRHVQLASG